MFLVQPFVNLVLKIRIPPTKEEIRRVLIVQLVGLLPLVVPSVKFVVLERMVLIVKIVRLDNIVQVTTRPRIPVKIAPLVLVKVVKVKLHVCPAFQARFKTFQVNLPVTNALKILRVNKQIRPNVIPVVMVKNL